MVSCSQISSSICCSTVHETIHGEWQDHQADHISAGECIGKYILKCLEEPLCNKAVVVLTWSLISVFSDIMQRVTV